MCQKCRNTNTKTCGSDDKYRTTKPRMPTNPGFSCIYNQPGNRDGLIMPERGAEFSSRITIIIIIISAKSQYILSLIHI